MKEFFKAEDGITILLNNNGTYIPIDENNGNLIDEILVLIKSLYPKAYNSLFELYGKAANYKWLIIRRFINCNWSIADNKPDIDDSGFTNLETVPCPLRCECRYDHVICNPELSTVLSKREIEVVKLICEGLDDNTIADRLYLSYWTVGNHRKHIHKKISCHTAADIIVWARKNNIIN